MLSADDIKWIASHAADDTSKLRLRHANDDRMAHLIMQVENRHKYQKKLSQSLTCDAFEFPTSLSGEQATSDRLSEFHASLMQSGEKVADMTAGLGIDSLHFALKASSVTAIERDETVARTLIDNATAMNRNNITVINADCTEWVKHTEDSFTTTFIDPARRGSHGERIFALSQCVPDVITLLNDIAAISPRLIVKMSPMLDITQVTRELPDLTDMYAIGTPDECKELVGIVNFGTNPKQFTCHAITLNRNSENIFSFLPDQENEAVVSYGLPDDARYLYEPHPSVMKMAPYKIIATRYGVIPLHPNTHIYASNHYAADFPGTIMMIDEIMTFSSATLKKLQRLHIEASVTTRNFVMSASKLTARIKNRESSTNRLFGVTVNDPNQPHRLILAHITN